MEQVWLTEIHTLITSKKAPLLPPLSLQGDDGKWNKFGGRLAWDKGAICANNPAFGGGGAYKNCEDYPAAPNIDHTQVGGGGSGFSSCL